MCKIIEDFKISIIYCINDTKTIKTILMILNAYRIFVSL
ncbi:hypothetical protein IYC_06926 [Clostridium sporogenes PA 3679]|uniref:Uncharacterized protein n=1 Tax=Clostridium sporogenes TaxID=1509 RepID=A0A7U4JS04_CLOSG|nr:hypothetical protein CLSPO_c35030 [Clostridium sporogenes]EHN15872.1 hypothetical protein IYC_06926 [Clostridium sporogenes PA 3679]KCZ66681.1 hypothetical protein CSPO_11c01330 [Clostridium sporogenes]SQB89288.1 Uncharacterised protein [Clostridium sporogenes]